MEEKKIIKHIAANGEELEIICELEYPKHEQTGVIGILVKGNGIKHEYPNTSSVSNNILYLDYCTYKGKKLRGIKDVKGLQEWYNEARKIIEQNKKLALEREIEKDKKAKDVEFHISYNGAYTSNKYLQSLNFNNLNKKEIEELKKIGKLEDADIGDYSATYYYSAPMDKLISFLGVIKEQRRQDAIKAKEKEIKELEDRISKKNVPFKNLYAIDKDLSTGLTYYTFVKRVDIKDFNKVRKYFEYIKPYEDDYDPMYGSKFKGYATTRPAEVCDILYPNWREEELKELQIKLEKTRKEMKCK